MWVENSNLVERNVQDLRNLTEVDTVSNLNGVDNEGLLGEGGVDVMLLVVGHNIVGCNKCGYIATSLFGQVVINLPEVGVFSAGATNGLVYIARTAVVSGDSQRPVMISVVELLER